MSMRIAVIGSGIAGLGAAWLLRDAYDVTVYERNAYVGGHSNTVDAPVSEDRSIPVDTGFIVYNERTYPNLIGLFDALEVRRIHTDISFGVSVDGGRLENSGSSVASLFAQKRNIFSPRFHRMVQDILRFYRTAPGLLADGDASGMSLGEFLKKGRYSQAFIDDHLLPMAAAIWSCPVSAMGDFPAASFIRFFDNHGLLQVKDRPKWWTVSGGSREYVNRIRAVLAPRTRVRQVPASVQRTDTGVVVTDGGGHAAEYDRVIFACHGDEAHALLADQTPQEHAILSKFTYQKNRAILHHDAAQMPARKAVWSSWNYLTDRKDDLEDRQVSVTYWMNSLQSLDPAHPLFVTLNPIQEIDPAKIYRSFDYDHPVFDAGAVEAQTRLPDIQGQGGVWYCGSYCGYGFHEDGLGSAVAVARAFGVEAPWGHQPVHAMNAVGTKADAAVALNRAAAGSVEAAA